MKVHCVAPWGAEGRRGRYPLSGRHLIGNLLRNQEGRAGTAGKGVQEAQQQDCGHGDDTSGLTRGCVQGDTRQLKTR